MAMAKVNPLTEAEWNEVFEIRCLTKKGLPITESQQQLIQRAFESDPERYKELNAPVFDATLPVGSQAKYRS